MKLITILALATTMVLFGMGCGESAPSADEETPVEGEEVVEEGDAAVEAGEAGGVVQRDRPSGQQGVGGVLDADRPQREPIGSGRIEGV